MLATGHTASKIYPSHGDPGTNLIHGSLGPTNHTSNAILAVSAISAELTSVFNTHRQTDHATSVTTGLILCVA